MYEHDECNVVVMDQVELGVDVESGCGVVHSRCRHGGMAEIARADCRGMYSWWWDSHISPKNSKWLCENLRDMDVKVKQMIRIIEQDADSFASRAEMYYKRRPELMKLAEDFYRAYQALAERYGHATGVFRFAHKTMAEAFPDKVKSIPANGRTVVNCGDDSDDMPPEALDFDFGALMGLSKGFLSPDSKAGFDVLNGLFGSSSTEKGCFYSCVEVEGFEQAIKGTEEAEKEAAAIEMAKSLERINNLESELARFQDDCHQLEERAKEAESEIGQVKKAHLELEAAREAHILEFRKCLSEIKEIRMRASKVESELKKDVIREKTEKESAIQAFNHCLGILSELQKRFQHVKENTGEFGNECAFETLDHHLETVEEGCFFAEKLNLDLLSRLDALTQKMQSKDAEIFKKQKELGRFWTVVQEDRLHHVHVEDSLQRLKNIWFQSQEETRSLFAQLQENVQLLEDVESRIECSHKEIHKVQEDNTVLSEANAASTDLIRHLEKANSIDNEKLQKLEADSERQSSILRKVRSLGLDPENLVPSINELYAKFTEMKKTLEQDRSERTALQVKLAALDEFVEKNVLLEVDFFHLEMQLEEFQDKVQFLEESCKSLLEERLKTTHERDSLASQLQEAANQSNKLKEMNHRLETSLLDANSQLQSLMVRAKGIKDYLQNAEKDHEELQNKYLILAKEKESLISKLFQLQIELDMKEECEEELEKSLHANMDGLFSSRAVQDFKERNSSFLFKFQTLIEVWKFSQVQISYLEQENLVQQSELQFLSDQIDVGGASIHVMLKSYPGAISPEEPFKPNCDYAKNIIQKVHDWHESLSWIEEAYLEASVEKSVLGFLLVQMKQESAEVVSYLNMTKIENRHLKELLERSMNEIGEIKSENDLLQCEDPCGKDLLVEKESRNMKNEKMLKSVDGEKEMQRKLYNLKMELANTKLAKEDQEKQILKLSDDLSRQIVESEYLRKEIRRMECQLLNVSEEYREVCRKERTWWNKVEIGEACIAAVFCDVVLSNLREAILEDRVREVAEAYQKECKSKNTEIERLRQFVWSLESDNVELVSQLDALKMETNCPDESAIEQNGSAGVSTGDATKDNKDSNLKRHDPGIDPRDDDNVKVAEMIAFYQPASEISLAQNEFMTKEIVLDQSFGFFSYAGSKTLAVEADNRMLELWETSDASSNIDLKVGKPLKTTRLNYPNFDHEARKDGSVPDHCEEDSLDEKDLGVDKQEISESAAEHKQGVSKRKLMERLNTDTQKLTNLHITLNDLQRMVGLILRSVQELGGEYDAINAQLEEARITTTKLSEMNTKLIKAVEKWFHTKPTKPTSEAMDDGGSFIRRRISEKARRGSEKVAKLQTEVQKMQFLLLKLGEQKENKGKARVVDRMPRVLLKDYLNSRLRSGERGGQKQKKGQFCACVQLPNRRN